MAKKYEFEDSGLVLDSETGLLTTRAGDVVEMRHQTGEVLALLVRSPGRVVTKAEFARQIWDGREVSDDSLVQCIAEIRSVLGDTARNMIRTVPRKGYKFEPPMTPATSTASSTSFKKWMAAAAFGILAVTAVVVWFLSDGCRNGAQRRLQCFRSKTSALSRTGDT